MLGITFKSMLVYTVSLTLNKDECYEHSRSTKGE
jgi:hypothetical protein